MRVAGLCAHVSEGCSVLQTEGRSSGVCRGGTRGWGSGRRGRVSAACTPLAHPTPLGPCPRVGRGVCVGLEDSGPRPGSWAAGGVGELGLRGPCSRSWCHPTHLPLPAPTHHPPPWTDQPHKALFMPGGWPGAPEGGWGRRGGSHTHGQGTSGSIRGRPRRHPPWGWIQ